MTTTSRALTDGMVLGLIAYAAVAAFHAVFDVLAARGTLYTVDLLGKAAFRGRRDPAALQLPREPDLAAIFLYNAVHLVASLAIGCGVAWLIHQAEARPASTLVFVGAIVGGYVATILAVGLLTSRPFLTQEGDTG